MSVFKDGQESYVGQVLKLESHYWLDGMEDEYAIVWDMENHETKRIKVGYYGADFRNLMNSHARDDATEEVKRDVVKTLRGDAYLALACSIKNHRNEIRNGSQVVVERGRKVPKGTELEVFWVGEKETYRSRQYGWMNETETIVGGKTAEGEKVWVKAEYCRVTDKIKTPNRKERKKFISAYINDKKRELNI